MIWYLMNILTKGWIEKTQHYFIEIYLLVFNNGLRAAISYDLDNEQNRKPICDDPQCFSNRDLPLLTLGTVIFYSILKDHTEDLKLFEQKLMMHFNPQFMDEEHSDHQATESH